MNNLLSRSIVRPGMAAMGAVLVSLVMSAGAWAQDLDEHAITGGDEAAGKQFGRAVAVDGDVAVVGTTNDKTLGNFAGAIYVYRWNGSTWNSEGKFLAPDGATNHRFGCSVAVSGNRIVVGADGNTQHGSNAGSAYVFEYTGGTWSLVQQLFPHDPASGKRFGSSVGVSGSRILVGAWRDNENGGTGAGAVYAYLVNGSQWPAPQQKILASDGAAWHYFGDALSIESNTAVIGAPGHAGAGMAYVFSYSAGTWTKAAQFNSAETMTSDMFGFSVDINGAGDLVVVGARNAHLHLNQVGRAYVFRKVNGAWLEEQTLLPADNPPNATFGSSVSLNGSLVVVGAPNATSNGPTGLTGAAYVYGFNGVSWNQLLKYVPTSAEHSDKVGTAVALRQGMALVGAPQHDTLGVSSAGAVFQFSLTPPDPNAPSCSADLDGDGVVSVSDLLILLGSWGPCPPGPCPADLDGDGRVNILDLFQLFEEWGDCPV